MGRITLVKERGFYNVYYDGVPPMRMRELPRYKEILEADRVAGHRFGAKKRPRDTSEEGGRFSFNSWKVSL